MKILSVLYLFLAVMMASPYLQLRVAERRRRRLLATLERDGGGAAVALIHRQETIAVMGLPLIRFVTVPLPREIAAAVRRVPQGKALTLVVHLPGGLAWDVEPLRAALAARSGSNRLVVPACCLGCGDQLAAVVSRVSLSPGAVIGDRPEDIERLRLLCREIDQAVPLAAVRLLDRTPQPARRRPSPLFLPLPARLRTKAAASASDADARDGAS